MLKFKIDSPGFAARELAHRGWLRRCEAFRPQWQEGKLGWSEIDRNLRALFIAAQLYEAISFWMKGGRSKHQIVAMLENVIVHIKEIE